MDLEPTAEHRQIRETVATFADNEVAPLAAEIDETDTFPSDLVAAMGELGIMGVPFDEAHDGAGLDYHSYAIAVEEISRASGGVGTIIAAHTSLAGGMVEAYGTESQKERFLAPLNRGNDIGAFALSEQAAGSDISAIETIAERDGNGYVVEGGKLWTSNGSVADTVVIFAKTDPTAGRDGITAFVVRPAEDHGFHVEGTEEKLGDRGCPTAELRFDDMRLPEDRRLGAEGEGFHQALSTLNAGRIAIAARSVGIARAAFEAARDYAEERQQFGRPIGEFQAIQHRLADMDTDIEAARLLTHLAADRYERGERFVKEAAQAKLFASEVGREVADAGLQIHGGYGYVRDLPLERYYRDAKLGEIYEGTSEVLRNTIAQEIRG